MIDICMFNYQYAEEVDDVLIDGETGDVDEGAKEPEKGVRDRNETMDAKVIHSLAIDKPKYARIRWNQKRDGTL